MVTGASGACSSSSASNPSTSTTPATTTTPSSSLRAFLSQDIHPQDGHRLLLPFLTTMERLHLSVCAQDLKEYRHHLTKIKVVHPGPDYAGKRRDLLRLLSCQRRSGGLEYLCVGNESMMDVLNLASWNCFEGLKTLDLQYLDLGERALDYVAKTMEDGWLKGLGELNLAECKLQTSYFDLLEVIMSKLAGGACPQLRRLDLRRQCLMEDYGEEEQELEDVGIGHCVATTLDSGHLRHLRELNLSARNLGEEGMEAIARALERGACPQLTKLDLSQSYPCESDDGEALAEAMRSGSCAKLEELYLREYKFMDDEGFMAIFEALVAGSCPSLKQLDLAGVRLSAGAGGKLEELYLLDHEDMSEEGFMAIFRALEAGCCPSLKKLDFAHARLLDGSATAFGNALESIHCQHLRSLHLRHASTDASFHALKALQDMGQWGGGGSLSRLELIHLNLADTGMGQDHGRMLGEAMRRGRLSGLETLDLSGNHGLGRGGVVPFMGALEGERCHRLKSLDMRDVSLGPMGAHTIARALLSECFPCLAAIHLGNNRGVGDHAMPALIEGLKHCQRLRSLDLPDMGMASKSAYALFDALGQGYWVEVEKIDLSSNPGMGGWLEAADLSGVLERGGGRGNFPYLRTLCLRECGLSQEGSVRVSCAIEMVTRRYQHAGVVEIVC